MDISRRNFLKPGAVASALGLGGAALAGCSSPSSASESEGFRRIRPYGMAW